MTLAELMDVVKLLVPAERMAGVTDGALAQAINVAQDDVSRALRAPTQTVLYDSVDGVGAFSWPTDARDDGIVQVYALTLDSSGAITNSTMIPVYDFKTASTYEPDWSLEEPATVARFIVYDPTAEVAVPYPVPPPDSTNIQAYRITYVVAPSKMSALTDQPFQGRLDSFHDVLAYRVAWLLTGNQQFQREYERRMNEAHGASGLGIVTVKNPLYSRTVIAHGRG